MTEILGCIDIAIEDYSSIPIKVFTSDWFSGNILRWDHYKSMFFDKENMHCLEIGSWEGKSTIYIAENYCNGKGSYIDALDTWKGSIENSDDIKNGLYERFTNNLRNYIDTQRVYLHVGYSSNTLMKFVQEIKEGIREKYDFIYIDGSHTAKDVLMDAVLAWEVLKINGLMLFDDYQWDQPNYKDNPPMTPKPAIDGFLNSYSTAYTLLHKGYQVHIQKTADSPY